MFRGCTIYTLWRTYIKLLNAKSWSIVLCLVITHLRPGLEPFVELVHPVLRLHRVGRVSPVKRTERRGVEGVARRAGHGFCYRQRARSASTRRTWSTTIVNIHTHTHARALADTRRDATVKSYACSAVRGEQERRRGGGRTSRREGGIRGRGGGKDIRFCNWRVFPYCTVWQVGQLEQNPMECNHCLLLLCLLG